VICTLFWTVLVIVISTLAGFKVINDATAILLLGIVAVLLLLAAIEKRG
jgi:hypothetical protein